MKSSTLLALRALVMLLSLVAIPLAALLGSGSAPGLLAYLEEICGARAESAPGEIADEPIAVATPSAPPTTALAVPLEAVSMVQEPMAALAPAPGAIPQPPTPAFWLPADEAAGSSQAEQVAGAAVGPVQPASYLGDSPEAHNPGVDRLAWLQQRLQDSGAIHYRLETAGTEGELFRFQCKMGSPANPNYVRYFEATSADAARAMQHVLEQVDAWRSGGQPPR